MALRRGALILAAGASSRMGTPKALLPWRGTTLLDHALEQARSASVSEIVVVLGPATVHLRLDCKTAFNPAPESGRSTSIRVGAAELADDLEAILIQSVDQPVPREVLEALFGAAAEVAIPTYGGRRGHPVCVSSALLEELRAVTEEEQGLRAVVRRHAVTEVAVDDASVLWNLNDPAAYAAAMGQR
ncbi:MAG TPA: nucleotidyltransferase family protein [Chloroflexota bacterium]|nr:nucleotidyltransferase family protein [Chloroflexota bacterium]